MPSTERYTITGNDLTYAKPLRMDQKLSTANIVEQAVKSAPQKSAIEIPCPRWSNLASITVQRVSLPVLKYPRKPEENAGKLGVSY